MNDYQKKRIKEAFDYFEFLDDYEINFINNIAEKPDNYDLTYKQNKLLNKISEKIAKI